jgi:hypothetical protein
VTPTVVVIGAGSAGLAVAAALRRRRIDPIILEQGATVATSWRNRHQDLHLNTIRWLSKLPGPQIPRSAGRWVSRDDYITYLERFTRRQQLDVHFGVRAERVDPAPGGWQVSTTGGRHRADHVVVATGHDRIPRLPDWPGRSDFRPPILHVADLRRAADLAGLRVLLVGGSNRRGPRQTRPPTFRLRAAVLPPALVPWSTKHSQSHIRAIFATACSDTQSPPADVFAGQVLSRMLRVPCRRHTFRHITSDGEHAGQSLDRMSGIVAGPIPRM